MDNPHELPSESIFKKFWNGLKSLDTFIKLYLLTMLAILVAIPIISNQPTNLSSHAASTPIASPTPTPVLTGQTMVNFQSNPTGSEIWLDYAFKGYAPMNLMISSLGSHHIGFYKYGYHSNTVLETNLTLTNSAIILSGDLIGGQILLSSPNSFPIVAPTSNPTNSAARN